MNGKVSTDYNHRNVYIDALRFFLFCAVVIAHMYTSDFVVKLQVSSVIDALMRFCVPCFFMISGYFLPEKIENIWTYLKKSFVRLFTPFIFWEIVYNLLNCVFHFAITDPINSGMDIIKILARTVVFGGAAFHLWFLPSLWGCLAIVVVSRQWIGVRKTFMMGVSLYIIGLLLGPYHDFIPSLQPVIAKISQHPDAFTARNGPFFGVIFVSIGLFIAQTKVKYSNLSLLVCLVSGAILSLIEIYIISASAIRPKAASFDFLFGSVLYSVPLLLLFLQFEVPKRLRLLLEKCAALGRVSLGMYCVHGLFILMVDTYLKPYLPHDDAVSLVIRAAIAVLIIITSAALAFYGYKIRRLKKVFA